MPAAVQLLFFVGIMVIFWMLLIRPAKRQQRAQRELLNALQVGDEVVLSSGIFGTIKAQDDAKIQLEIAPGTVISIAKQVVVRRVEDEPADAATDTVPESDDGSAVVEEN